MLDSINNQRQNGRVSTRLRVIRKRVIRETETIEIEEIVVSYCDCELLLLLFTIIYYIILYRMLAGKIKIEVAIHGAAPIWEEVGEERDRKGVVTWGTLGATDTLSRGDYEDVVDLQWYEDQTEECLTGEQETIETDLLRRGKVVVGALWGNISYNLLLEEDPDFLHNQMSDSISDF